MRRWWRGPRILVRCCGWHGLGAASVADDTRSPRNTWETCRKALGTAGGQVHSVRGLLCLDDTELGSM